MGGASLPQGRTQAMNLPQDLHSPEGKPPIPAKGRYFANEAERLAFVREIFDSSAHDYDRFERILAFGSGSWYRRDVLRRAGLREGDRVLDVATGTGLVAREAATLVGAQGMVIGVDPSTGMLGEASRSLKIGLVRARGERLPFREASFDFVSMGFALRHVADLGLLFGELRRVLRPGGTACILEITRPASPTARALTRSFMTQVVPVFSLRSSRRAEARKLMGFYWDTIDACVPPRTILDALVAAGFAAPSRVVSLGLFSEYVADAGEPVVPAGAS
jgi:demethylmenaquinone methyltransferase/2-methoxy-6-polyprenyl-1,4-benzoquinol methylase